MMEISHLDHLVLTVKDIATTCKFYETILGMKFETFEEGRKALKFGNQKINLHLSGNAKVKNESIGSAHLCFIIKDKVETVLPILKKHQIKIEEEGIVVRKGALGMIKSIYFYDPDGNLIEVSNYI